MQGLVRAPEIDRPGFEWFNVTSPLRLSDLRGRLVILDFWTFCCVNCLHVASTLKRVETAFPDELVVIGVHSPKFPAEREHHNLRAAIARCGVKHPIIQDPDMTLWSEYCVSAWPTLVFIGPEGTVVGTLTGEPDPDRLLGGVGAMLHEWRAQGMLKTPPLPLDPIDDPGGGLRFPGKIKPFGGTNGEKRWAVADSGHHQIVLYDDSGRELTRYGSGKPGFLDCDFTTSAFNSPQGLICGDGFIYVADTGNHAIRRIDLEKGEVATLAGTGRRGCALDPKPSSGTETDLASVWDLELSGNHLYFANAGSHQIGELDLTSLTVRSLAGSSIEDIVDGPAQEAHLAQPSGLARDPEGRVLYFADSETSSVRSVSLDDAPCVRTLVGAGLFECGCRNGTLERARMQHPLGLTWCEGNLIVADSFNGKLRRIDLDHGEVSDLKQNGEASNCDCTLPAGEPAGVVADGPGRLLMTDTNNHRVVEVLPDEGIFRTWAR